MIKLDQYVPSPNGIRLHSASVGEPGKSLVLFVVHGFPLFDVQCFDLRAVASYRRNPAHQAMSASMYANPHSRGAVCNLLDTMILGAAEIDLRLTIGFLDFCFRQLNLLWPRQALIVSGGRCG